MKVTWDWLAEWADLPEAPEELAGVLAMRGFPVQSLEQGTAFDAAIVVGRVLDTSRHPNADRLTLCRVDTGSEPLSIVCGAPNVAAGQRVAVALVGSRLPDGTRLRKSTIRGVESQGMICSERELGLSEESEGIWVLPIDAAVGVPLASVLKPAETVLDVEITSNRSDCMCVRGLAREIAAARRRALKDQAPLRADASGALPVVTIESEADCPRYMARVVRGLRVGASPRWLQRRIEAVGHRSINNIVDATNYVLHEYGQPIHAFDAAQVSGYAIRVRRARVGEHLVILDGRDVALHEGVLLIADAEQPIALAGIMGGLESGVGERTTDVILESAQFAPSLTRDGARSIGVETEASARFGQGVDPHAVPLALDATARLLAEVSGGAVVGDAVDLWPRSHQPIVVQLSHRRTARLLGMTLEPETITEGLQSLEIEAAAAWAVDGPDRVAPFRIPAYRHDLLIEEDLIEEVARAVGYDSIPSRVAAASYREISNRSEELLARRLCEIACGLGYNEAVNTCLVGPIPTPARDGIAVTEIWELQNPKSREIKHLRVGLLPGLLQAAARNLHHGLTDVRLVEIGKAFRARPAPIGSERLEGALLLSGTADPWWAGRSDDDRYLEIRGAVEAMLGALGIDSLASDSYHESCWRRGTGATIGVSGRTLGRLGEISAELAEWASLPRRAWAALLDIAALAEVATAVPRYQALSRYPAVKRDLALLVARAVRHAEVVAVIHEAGAPLLDEVRLFDVYEGPSVPQGVRSMAYALQFRVRDRTLSDREVDGRMEAIVTALASRLNAVQRGAAVAPGEAVKP